MKNKFGEQLGKFLNFSNISINEFAERVGTTPKNMIDIVKGNVSITQNMIYNISFVTGISVDYIENVERSFRNKNIIDEFLKRNNITITQFINKFKYNEFSKLYDFQFTDIKDKYNIAEDILKYLRITSPDLIYKDSNSILYKSRNDKPELLALWLEHCYRCVMKQDIKDYKKENIMNVVEFIRNEAKNNRFNKEKLIKVFNDNGIFLAIEPDLKGSKIRGAFRVLNDKPAIYITTKHKRYADIYFALFYELAHCKSDFNRAKSGSIVSTMDDVEIEDYEIKADKTALNWMVSDDIYDQIKRNYSKDIGNSIIMPFVVYRLALDGIITYSSKFYQDNNKLIDIDL